MTGTNIIQATRYSESMIKLMRKTVAKDCNDDEFSQFLQMCADYDANPFKKQIYAIVTNKGDADKRQLVPVMAIDFLRARTLRAAQGLGFKVRAMEARPEFTYDEELKSPWNPLGLVSVSVAYHVSHDGTNWNPVVGEAYWDEFAPLQVQNDGTYKIAYGKEMWLRMPRNQLAKCAEAKVCRLIAPDDVGGIYVGEEMDRPMIDITAEVERIDEEGRLKRIGSATDIYHIQWMANSVLEAVQGGHLADRCFAFIAACRDAKELETWREVNRAVMQQFWALHKADALGVKQAYEARMQELSEAVEQTEPTLL